MGAVETGGTGILALRSDCDTLPTLARQTLCLVALVISSLVSRVCPHTAAVVCALGGHQGSQLTA